MKKKKPEASASYYVDPYFFFIIGAVTVVIIFEFRSYLSSDFPSNQKQNTTGLEIHPPNLPKQNATGLEICRQEFIDRNIIIIDPSSELYRSYADVTYKQYNIPSQQPSFVVLPSKPVHIQAVLQCAFKQNIRISVRSGGHNYAGFSQAPGSIQMSLQLMKHIHFFTYNGEPAIRVEAGARGVDIFPWLNASHSEYVMASGLCPSVGIAGFHLGGGLGALCRQYGMGVDNVLEIKMVTANGSKIVTANNNTNKLLYWALRGGGGPSFGVVTEFVIRLHPSFPKYTYAEYCSGNDIDIINRSLTILGEFTKQSDFPDWLTVDWRLVKRNNNNTGLCYLIYALKGQKETMKELSNLFASIFHFESHEAFEKTFGLFSTKTLHPGLFKNFIEEYSYFLDMEIRNAEYKNYLDDWNWPSRTKNCILPALNPSMIEKLLEIFVEMPDTSRKETSCYVQGMCLGGTVISRVPKDDTAFPWRDRVLYAADAGCEIRMKEDILIAENFVTEYVRKLSPWCKGAYLNFPFSDLENYAEKYWGDALPRLKLARKEWNPHRNYPLSFPQEVPLD